MPSASQDEPTFFAVRELQLANLLATLLNSSFADAREPLACRQSFDKTTACKHARARGTNTFGLLGE